MPFKNSSHKKLEIGHSISKFSSASIIIVSKVEIQHFTFVFQKYSNLIQFITENMYFKGEY